MIGNRIAIGRITSTILGRVVELQVSLIADILESVVTFVILLQDILHLFANRRDFFCEYFIRFSV